MTDVFRSLLFTMALFGLLGVGFIDQNMHSSASFT